MLYTVVFAILMLQHARLCVCKCNCTETPEGLSFDCSYQNIIGRIPRFPNDTISLNLTGNNLHTLKEGSFSNLRRLKVLDISSIALCEVKDGAFKGLQQLQFLNISRNENLPMTSKGEYINASVFKDLPNLIELRMYGTTTANLKSANYPSVALGHLPNLHTLWMDGMTNRTFLPGNITLWNLQTLRFSGDLVGFGFCDMFSLTGRLVNVGNLTHLYILKCGLKVIHKDAFINLHKLQYLDLSFNKLLTLQNAAKAFGSLEKTNISILVLNEIIETNFQDCGMIIRDTDFEGLKNTKLVELRLEHNRISNIKSGKKWPNYLPPTLKIISLRDNTLNFDLYIFYTYLLRNLTHLDVSYQYFQELWDQKSDQNVNQNIQVDISSDARTAEYDVGTSLTAGSNQRVCQKPFVALPYIVPYLPQKLEYVDCSHSKMNHPLYNMSVNANNSLKILNASRSMLYCWQGPIYGLHKLEYLDLSDNFCGEVSHVFFDEFKSLKELNIANNRLNKDISGDVNCVIMKNLKQLQRLDMSNNRLRNIPECFLKNQSNLQVLKLNNNVLTSFGIRIDHMKNLQSVDLRENYITTFSKSELANFERIADNGHLTLNLKGNYLHCYCKQIDTLKWIRKNNSTRLTFILEDCIDEKENKISLRTIQDLDKTISQLERECVRNVVAIVTATIGTVILTDVIVGILVYRYRWKLRYWYYVSRHYYRRRRRKYHRINEPDENSDIKYDVYVICMEDDAGSQFVRDMFTHLETENGLTLIEQERNFLRGRFVSQMICSAIHQSRVSVFVMTKEWVSEGSWEFPMQICRQESEKRGRRMYFSVFPEGLPDDSSSHKRWCEICDVANSSENLEYPKASRSADNVNSILTFWKQCHLKITTMMQDN